MEEIERRWLQQIASSPSAARAALTEPSPPQML
jgi:hypothetical protein